MRKYMFILTNVFINCRALYESWHRFDKWGNELDFSHNHSMSAEEEFFLLDLVRNKEHKQQNLLPGVHIQMQDLCYSKDRQDTSVSKKQQWLSSLKLHSSEKFRFFYDKIEVFYPNDVWAVFWVCSIRKPSPRWFIVSRGIDSFRWRKRKLSWSSSSAAAI